MILLIGINVISMLQNGLEINSILLFIMIMISSKCSMDSIFQNFFNSFCIGCAIVFLSCAFNIISDEINIRYSADFLSSFFFIVIAMNVIHLDFSLVIRYHLQ